jgi:GNAT superfamily N-acetyltransferase
MTAQPVEFTIDELTIPDRVDGEHGAAFAEMIDVRNIIEAQIFGSEDLAVSAAELLPNYHDAFQPKRVLVARVNGHIVGRSIYEYAPAASESVAWLTAEVPYEHRHRGIGGALLEGVEAMAVADGRTSVQTYALADMLEGERLESPTGFGSLPLQADGVSFLVNRGWTLEQVERASKLTLPVDDEVFERHLSEAHAASEGYRVHTWISRTPPEWREGMALLSTRMSTDAPSAGLDSPEDPWTVERLLDYEERHAASPRRLFFAAVEHIDSGQLAGYTALSVPAEVDRSVTQDDTIVMREHRGHRLGMLLKLANIEHLEREDPGHPSITTFNAEENRHMLSVNEAVGFVPVGYEGAWQKKLG